jgi:hypothetical protein
MRTLRALALAAVLTVSSGTAAFAGDGGSYAQPVRPTQGTIQGDGGSYATPAEPVEIRNGEFWG